MLWFVLWVFMLNWGAIVTSTEVEFRIDGITRANLTNITVNGGVFPVVAREDVTLSVRLTPHLGVVLVIKNGKDWNWTNFREYGAIIREYLLSEQYSQVVVRKIPYTKIYIHIANVSVNTNLEALEHLLDALGGRSTTTWEDYDIWVHANCPNGSFFNTSTSVCAECTKVQAGQYASKPCGVVSDTISSPCSVCREREYEYCPCGAGGALCPSGNRICYPYPIWNATINAVAVSARDNQTELFSYGQWISASLRQELYCDAVSSSINGVPQAIFKDISLTGNVSYFVNITFRLVNCWNPRRTGNFTSLSSITNATAWRFIIATSELDTVSCSGVLLLSSNSANGGVVCVPPLCGAGEEGVPGLCTACKAGTYKSAYGDAVCDACPIGYFQPLVGATACIKCSMNGTVTVSTRSTRSQDCKCDIGMYLWNGSACLDCLSGKYGTGYQVSTCFTCRAGTYSAQPRSRSCQTCPLNQYSASAGASACRLCDTGTGQYLDLTGGTACKRCGTGQGLYLDNAQLGTCRTCVIGGYSMAGLCRDCEKGTYATVLGATSMGVCKTCPVGSSTFSKSASSCQLCPPGMYGFKCASCPAGAYSSGIGSLSCINCEPGTYLTVSGATSVLWCVNCESGKYFSGDITQECLSCPENTISASGAVSSDECWSSDGYYGDVLSGVYQCPANHYCRRGARKPAPCPAGHGSNPGSDSCGITNSATSLFFDKIFDWVVTASWVAATILGIGFFIKFRVWKLFRVRKSSKK